MAEAHDLGLVNEIALRDVLQELLEGQPLTDEPWREEREVSLQMLSRERHAVQRLLAVDAVSKFETGERRLDVIEFLDVTRALGVDPHQMLRGLPPI